MKLYVLERIRLLAGYIYKFSTLKIPPLWHKARGTPFI